MKIKDVDVLDAFNKARDNQEILSLRGNQANVAKELKDFIEAVNKESLAYLKLEDWIGRGANTANFSVHLPGQPIKRECQLTVVNGLDDGDTDIRVAIGLGIDPRRGSYSLEKKNYGIILESMVKELGKKVGLDVSDRRFASLVNLKK
jgi:hypothetical protein